MAIITPSDGVNEREPTLIPDGALRDVDGAEYRLGEAGLFVARGRQLVGSLGSVTGLALYEAGFDGTTGFVVAQAGDNLYSTPIVSSLAFSSVGTAPSGSSAMVGSHYANRHYLAFGTGNRKLELSGGAITSSVIGMSRSTLTVGVSVTQGAGVMSATMGLVYWATEYDSVRGMESMTGSSASTGSFSNVDGVMVSVTGVSANDRADQIRWYRSADGGGFPDGGLIATTNIGGTSITDSQVATASLTVPQYGIVSIAGLEMERDEPPPPMHTIFGPFQDSLLGVYPAEPRSLRFTPAGYPDSWPPFYAIPLETHRRDEIVAGVVLPGRIGVFCIDSVHVVYRLPRDSDSIFAAGEASDVVSDAHGCVGRKAAASFSPPGHSALAAWVARDGICVSDLTSSPVIVTNRTKWSDRINVQELGSCVLVDDPLNRRLVFIYKRVTDTSHNTGVWYLDYQEYAAKGIRITYADHGPLADAVTFAAADGNRRLVSVDSRSGNGQVYVESVQDADDSHLLDSNGSIRFRMRSKEFLPAGARGTISLGKATWMHDAGPPRIEHRFYFNRRDANPEIKILPESEIRTASDVVLGRNVNSVSVEIESTGVISYGVHWIDMEMFEAEPLAGRKGG